MNKGSAERGLRLGRCLCLIKQAIHALSLDLSGLSVLTEAASGYYSLTPMIAALAGAEKVYAVAADSRYGTSQDVADATVELARTWGVEDRIEVITRESEVVTEADVVTNLGFVRPLDRSLLVRLKAGAAISLMWETWEFREEELDLVACRELGIPVLGTNEHHPALGTFEYFGPLVGKLLLDSGVEIVRSSVVLLGDGEFPERAEGWLRGAGAEVVRFPAMLETQAFLDVLREADALVLLEHHDRGLLVGDCGRVTPRALAAANPSLLVVHVCGGADRAQLVREGLACVPDRFALAGHMSVATDHVGPRPLVDLHTAGLHVGAQLARARRRGLGAYEAELHVLGSTPVAQGFAGYHSAEG